MANFMMLVGLPGSGKSTKAIELCKENEPCIIISSDMIRNELYGDESVQENHQKVFDLMQKRTVEALQNGKNVIYDATNLRRKNRIHLLKVLPRCQKTAIIVWTRFETCVERDKERNRHVGQAVVEKMIHNFQLPYYDEGWNTIKVIYNDTQYSAKNYYDWMNCEHDNPHHNNSIQEHTRKVCKEAIQAQITQESGDYGCTLFVAAHLHDIGKKFTKAFKDARGNDSDIAHFYNHHNVGGYFALGYSDINDIPFKQKMLIVWLVNNHMEPFFNSKYYQHLAGKEKRLLDLLHECDVKGA